MKHGTEIGAGWVVGDRVRLSVNGVVTGRCGCCGKLRVRVTGAAGNAVSVHVSSEDVNHIGRTLGAGGDG